MTAPTRLVLTGSDWFSEPVTTGSAVPTLKVGPLEPVSASDEPLGSGRAPIPATPPPPGPSRRSAVLEVFTSLMAMTFGWASRRSQLIPVSFRGVVGTNGHLGANRRTRAPLFGRFVVSALPIGGGL